MIATVRARATATLESEFIQQIIGTFGTRVALVGLGILTSVLTARALGPAGRGELAIAGAITAVAIQFGNLGLHATNTWVVAREPHLLARLVANSLVVSLLIGAGLAATVLLISAASPQLVPVNGPLLITALVGIPLGIATLLMGNLLIGTGRIRDHNVLELTARLLGLAAVVAVILASLASPLAFLASGTLVGAAVTAITGAILARQAQAPLRPQLALLQRDWRFGLKAYILALLSFLIIRADLFLVEGFLGNAAVGQYSVAVALADLVYSLPVVVGTLLFPRLSRMTDSFATVRMAGRVAIRVGALMSAGCVLATFLAQPAIQLFYGDEFVAAAAAFIWLLPGIVCLSVHTIVMNYFASVGYPRAVMIVLPAALVVNLVANVVLLPWLGIVGASAASSISYGAMLAVSGTQFWLRSRRERLSSHERDGVEQ